MSKLLASVNSLHEALTVFNIGVDIVDLKQPAQGALGALDLADVREIVCTINGRCPVSATIGDLPLHPESVFNAVQAMSETGVDYIKIGFFAGGDWQATLDRLSSLTAQGHQLIAVLLADAEPDRIPLTAIKTAGFKGVMLDTQDKQRGALTQIMSLSAIAAFVETAKKHNLLCGLAGALRLNDIPTLLPLQANYLGFRGALCEQHQRTASLNPTAIRAIKHALRPP